MKKSQKVKTMRWILLALVTTTAVDAQKYAIHMSTPVHAGQSYAVTATGSLLAKVLIGDRVVKGAGYQVNFKGRADVLEVDGKQQPFKIAFTVERFTKIEGGVTIDLLKSGSVIIADGSQQQPISVKDSSTEESVREAFELIYSAEKPRDGTDSDEIFGTKEAKGIGDRWSINLALASEKIFKDEGIIVPDGHLSGMVSLVAKDKIANTDCLSLRKELKADDLTSKDLPPGVKLDRSNFQGIILGCYPIEDSRHSYKEGGELTMQMLLTSNEGDKIDITRTEKRDEVWVAAGD
jgi:hypothetical protein